MGFDTRLRKQYVRRPVVERTVFFYAHGAGTSMLCASTDADRVGKILVVFDGMGQHVWMVDSHNQSVGFHDAILVVYEGHVHSGLGVGGEGLGVTARLLERHTALYYYQRRRLSEE